MRPAAYLSLVLMITVAGGVLLTCSLDRKRTEYSNSRAEAQKTVRALGLSDLAVSTEARYTRHPAASDPLVPFMDHPGGLEHFPSGSFYGPVR